MDVYLIRHTPVVLEKGICYGQSDVALPADCHQHFELVKNKLKGIQADLIYSSPALRCTQLAQCFSPSSEILLEERLWELNFGEWELQSWNDLNEDKVRRWTENYITEAPPSGETYSALFNRTKTVWEEKIAGRKEQSVFIITHGGVIRSILSYLLEIPLHKSFSLQIDLGSVTKIAIQGKFNMVEYINR